MEISEIEVDSTKAINLPWEGITVVPIGDVQLGAQGVDTYRLKSDIEWGLKNNAYFLGMGEYLDIASPSNRARIKSAGLYDSTEDAIEEIVDRKIKDFLRLTKGTKGRWLGMLEGHHLYEFRDGTTTDTRIAQALGTDFLGTCAFVRISFCRGNDSVTCTIWCHHGVGSGVKLSAPLNKLENITPYFEADIYLIGHQHKKVSATADRIYMTRKKPYRLDYRTIALANTGGYLRGYQKGTKQGSDYPRGGYVERGMRPPVSLGCISIRIRPCAIHRTKYRESKLDIGITI